MPQSDPAGSRRYRTPDRTKYFASGAYPNVRLQIARCRILMKPNSGPNRGYLSLTGDVQGFLIEEAQNLPARCLMRGEGRGDESKSYILSSPLDPLYRVRERAGV